MADTRTLDPAEKTTMRKAMRAPKVPNPGECPHCDLPRQLCKCQRNGGGGGSGGDSGSSKNSSKMGEHNSAKKSVGDNNGARSTTFSAPTNQPPRLVFSSARTQKENQEENVEMYEIDAPLEDVKHLFEEKLADWAKAKGVSVEQLKAQGYSAEIYSNVLTITAPREALDDFKNAITGKGWKMQKIQPALANDQTTSASNYQFPSPFRNLFQTPTLTRK